jgi:predicted RNA-binding protein with RPS1 domain
MAILDKLSDIGKSVAQKSGEIAESSKLTMSIKKKEKEIKSLKFEIGKYIYQQYKNSQEYDEKIQQFCADIDAAYEEISNLESERESVGIDDLDIEVVEADIADDTIDITEEEEEILKDL